jgi:tRNA G18 (ribose-2'-O)-methylase SpoU
MALLEDVRSLWNVGSIFRTADGAGFSLLYLCGITACPPRREILKTSLGAEENVAWDYYTSALNILPRLKEQGVQVVGLELTPASTPLATAVERKLLGKRLCLVVGNEVTGISAEVLPMCDLVCHLPMRGVKESLNVAVAFGIASYLLAEASLECGGVSQAGESC